MQHLRANYPNASCPIPTYLGSISYAFLAPALQEALQESSFASRTHIVPGEADDWCALHAKDNAQSIIFTSDSDLVLYDYRPETLIAFLHDDDGSIGIKAYAPDDIRKKLQLNSLLPFAFVLLSGPQDISVDLARNARGINQDSQEFIDFARRYVTKGIAPISLPQMNGSSLILAKLDVRVSEFVHQAMEGSTAPLVYMPLLIEDPNQASAWNMGYDVRTLAYSLFANTNMTVHERRRKAQGIAVQEIATYTAANITIPATELERQVSALTDWSTSKAASPELIWPLFAISLVLAELNTPPAIPLVLRVVNNDFDSTWSFVHLMARLQAALYSLRMLKQTVEFWLKLNATASSKLHTCLSSLAKHMQSFPPIPAMFGVSGQPKKVLAEYERLKSLIEEIYVSAGAKVPTEQVSNKKKKRQAREADRKKKKAEQRRLPERETANAFGALMTE